MANTIKTNAITNMIAPMTYIAGKISGAKIPCAIVANKRPTPSFSATSAVRFFCPLSTKVAYQRGVSSRNLRRLARRDTFSSRFLSLGAIFGLVFRQRRRSALTIRLNLADQEKSAIVATLLASADRLLINRPAQLAAKGDGIHESAKHYLVAGYSRAEYRCTGQGAAANEIPRMGFLSPSSRSTLAIRYEAFRQGMRELGYVERKNIVIESRYAEGKQDRVAALAAELVRLKVDVIVAGGTTATRAAKEATVTIPIVMTQDSDPVGNGVVASLARPGGNITGVSNLAPELSGKRLELLKEVLPWLSRVAVLVTPNVPQYAQVLKETELAAAALGVKLQFLEVLGPKDIETAFRAATNARAEAVLALNSFVVNSHHKQIVDLAVKSRLPAIYPWPEPVEVGGLMAYGVNLNDLARRAATYVHKILKGAKPADLPVEQPTKFGLVINLKTAKQIGLTIPPNVLARANRVIR